MPTFFSKILNLGKDKDKKGDSGTKEPQSPTSPKSGKRHSIHSLLEGKFEAVSPTVSEQGENAGKEQDAKGTAVESDSDKEKEKLVTLLSRPKARTKSPTRRSDDFPRLTLNLTLPGVSEGEKKGGARELRTVLEGTVDGAPLLDEATLGKTRLSSPEALKLMKACAGAINERGLDTLGVMHPHWHSASPQLQRRLISLFMASIGQSASPKAQTVFEDGMEFTRSPHDIASVFRWGLRHLQLEGHSFASAKNVEASATGPLSWYGSFVDDERAGSYPQSAFSTILLPRVKAPHVDLLLLTADLMSVLAAHSEANGVSGSKLSMILGQYLLIGSQEIGEMGWKEFYERWENSGRALEHIFLCYLREETSKGKIPKRVQELVAGYPYSKNAIEGDTRFSRPARFATRSNDALHVLITCEVPQESRIREENAHPLPLSVIENALKSSTSDDAKELEQTWNQIRTIANTPGEDEEVLEGKAQDKRNFLSRVLSDESIRLLGLRSDDTERLNKGTPTITMFSHVPGEARVYSKSYSSSSNGTADVPNGKGKESLNGISRNASEATTTASTTLGGPTPTSPIASDWTAFSSSGFGEDAVGSSLASTLMDTDVEKTQPVALETRRSLKKSGSKGHKGERAKSRERVGRRTNVTPLAASEVAEKDLVPPLPSWKTASVSIVKLDEAFVDFWADALLDPISRPWPTFVVCQLKSNVSAEVEGGRKINWLVVEQAFITPPPPPAPPVEEHPAQRASSPKPSVASDTTKRPGAVGRVSSTFKRFALFGSGTSYSDEKEGGGGKKAGAGKGVRVSEMGEIIHEEPTSPPMSPVPTVSNKEDKDKQTSSASKEGPSDNETAAAAAIAVGGVAVASALDQVAESLKPESESKVETTETTTEGVAPVEPALQSVEPDASKASQSEIIPSEVPVSHLAAEPESKVEEVVEEVKVSPEVVAPSSTAAPPSADGLGLSKEQEHAEEAAAQALSDADIPETEAATEVEKREDASLPEREVVGDKSAGETTSSALVLETPAPSEPPRSRSPGAGDSRFVEHLDSTPDIAEHAAPLDTVDEAGESTVVEKTEGLVAPANVIEVDAPVPETVVDEHLETEVKEEAIETAVVPDVTAEPSAEPLEQLQAEAPILEAPAVVEIVAEEPVQEVVTVAESPAPEQVASEAPAEEPQVDETIIAAEPRTDEPAVDTMVVEPPTEEHSAVDEPVSADPVSDVHDTSDVHVVEQPIAQETIPIVEEPVAEDLAVEVSEKEVAVPASEVPATEDASVLEATSVEPVVETPTAKSVAEERTAEAPAEATDSPHAVEDVQVSNDAEEPSVAETPFVGAPVVEESVAEAPLTDVPAVEEPVIEPPSTEESVVVAPIAEEPAVEVQIPPVTETAVEPQQVAEEQPAEETTVEVPHVAEPTAEALTAENSVPEEPVVSESVTEVPVLAEPAVEPQPVEESVTELPTDEQVTVEEPVAETTANEQMASETTAVDEPAVESPTVAAASSAESPATEAPILDEAVSEPPVTNETTDATVFEEPVVEPPVEEEVAEAARTVEDTPIQAAEEPTADGPPVENAVVEEPTAGDLTTEIVAGETTVAESAEESSSHIEPESTETVETEGPTENIPLVSADDGVPPGSDAPAMTEAPEETHAAEKAESAPELGQPSPPVVSGEVETTVHPEVPVIEDITSGPDASRSSEDDVESSAPVDAPTAEEQTEVSDETHASEHVETESPLVQAENGEPVEATKETLDEALPVETSDPPAVESSNEVVPDETQSS